MTNYAWQVTALVIALSALAGLMFIVGTGAFRLLLTLTERQPGRHQAHVILGTSELIDCPCCADDSGSSRDCICGWFCGQVMCARQPFALEHEPPEDWSPAAEYGDPEDVTGLTASAPDAPQASPVTQDPRDRAWWETAEPTAATAAAAKVPGPVAGHQRMHAVEVHPVRYTPRLNAATPLWADGENKRHGNWPMGEPWTPTGNRTSANHAPGAVVNLTSWSATTPFSAAPPVATEPGIPATPVTEPDSLSTRPSGDRGDFTESAWTKRSALDLEIRLAREQIDNGFDHIVDYATSGYAPRWEGAA